MGWTPASSYRPGKPAHDSAQECQRLSLRARAARPVARLVLNVTAVTELVRAAQQTIGRLSSTIVVVTASKATELVGPPGKEVEMLNRLKATLILGVTLTSLALAEPATCGPATGGHTAPASTYTTPMKVNSLRPSGLPVGSKRQASNFDSESGTYTRGAGAPTGQTIHDPVDEETVNLNGRVFRLVDLPESVREALARGCRVTYYDDTGDFVVQGVPIGPQSNRDEAEEDEAEEDEETARSEYLREVANSIAAEIAQKQAELNHHERYCARLRQQILNERDALNDEFRSWCRGLDGSQQEDFLDAFREGSSEFYERGQVLERRLESLDEMAATRRAELEQEIGSLSNVLK